MENTPSSRFLNDAVDRIALDRTGRKIGKIFDVYTDEDSGKPEWFAITSGIFGRKMSFAPILGAQFVDDDVELPFDVDLVKDAPTVEADGEMSQEDEARLYAHYNMGYSQARSETGLPSGTPPAAAPQQTNRTTPATDGDNAMTRSEEELSIDKRQREVGRARLHKWVETEHVNITVPVKREKARLVTEPITDANRSQATDGPEITERDHEIVLSEEEIIVEKKVVPKERVRLETETIVEQREVSEDLAKERVEFQDETGNKNPRPDRSA